FMNLWYLILRSWRERPARTILSILSVAIAIATVLGTALAQSGVRQGMRKLSSAVDKHPALEIVSASGGRFPSAEMPSLSGISGVIRAVPVTSRASTARIGGKRFRTVLAGLPLDNSAGWEALELTEGKPPAERGQAVLSADVAKS